MAQQQQVRIDDPPRSCSTYRELYATASYQSGEPVPARLLASYRFNEVAGGGERPTPASLIEQTLVFSERRSMAFLCLVRTQGTKTKVRVLHRMMRFLELPDAEGGAMVDMSMGLLGDVRAAQIPAVGIDNSQFSVIGNAGVRVPTVATMPDHLDAAPPGLYLGPFTADTPGTEVVRPRVTQVLPLKYAAALIHRDGVAPDIAYQEIYGLLEADDMLQVCADVITWLRVACTARGGAGELAPIPAVAQAFPILLLPAAVSEYVATKVEGDLLGFQNSLGRAAGGTGAEETPVVAAILRQLAEGVGADRNARGPKSVEEAYRETYPVLLRFCHVDSVEALAPLWGRLARGSKGEMHSILQQEFTKVCAGRGLTPDVYCPAVTSNVKQLVTSLNFAGHGKDDITVGCQPFLVAYSGADDHYRAMDDATLANQFDQGTANPSLADIREIRDKERIKLPKDLNQVGYTLRRYAVLAHALFQGPGATNPFVECLWILANVFNERLPVYLSEHQRLQGTAWYDVYPAHIVRHVQVNSTYEYLQALHQTPAGGTPPPLPSFQELHRCLQRGSFQASAEWLPLPPSLTVAPPAPASITPVGVSAIAVRTARAAAGGGSVVSALTGPTSSAGTSRDNGSTGVYTLNPARDAEFDALQLRPGMRQLLQANPPPRNDGNVEFCVSWWGRGGCYTNCGRAASHRPFANATERTRLLEFVRTHLTTTPTPAASAAST